MKHGTCTRHAWVNSGGCRENPGFFGVGGAAIAQRQKCRRCGAERKRIFGDLDKPTRNYDWRIVQEEVA